MRILIPVLAVIGSFVPILKAQTNGPAKPAPSSAVEHGRDLVNNGKSPFVIYCDPKAPSSVKEGAAEIQRILRISTGAYLPIVGAPQSPMICLGDNAASREAGLSSEGMPDEAFRIVTRGANLYILGTDWPDKEKKRENCDSTGTLYGCYEFLESVVGVRWLMPGEAGEDIPNHPEGIKISEMDRSDKPAVGMRKFEVNSDALWLRRNRIGQSIQITAGHNFSKHPSSKVLEAHPEYMPLQADGTREKPQGERAWGSNEHKLCLSNQGLIDAFAESLMEDIARNPQKQCVSVSPSDGGLWCVCSECQKFKLSDGKGIWGNFPPAGHSLTPLVLQFYNGVARRIREKYPDHIVAGYAYHDYFYPPYDGVKLEPNCHIQIAISAAYGFKFYKPDRAESVQRLISEWAKIAPRLGWYDYSTWMRNAVGAPLPPGLPILKTIFPAFGNSLSAIQYAGQGSWGYGGVHNYLVARLMWKNDADIDAIYREYLDRAYGPAAGTMDEIYQVIEESLRKFIIQKDYPDHEIWYETVVRVYVPIYEEIESLYAKALSETTTPAQKQRLEMFGANLVMLNWNMRQAGLLKEPEKYPSYRTDEDYEKFLLESRANGLRAVEMFDGTQYRWPSVLWAPEKRVLAAEPIPAGVPSPESDGDLADPAWTSSATAGDFRSNVGRRGPAEEQTEVRVAYDPKNLYVAFACDDPDTAKLRTDAKVANSRMIFSDDYVQVLLQPSGKPPLNVAVSAGGTAFCSPDSAEGIRTAVKVAKGKWFAEFSIPWKALGLSGPPDATLPANFGRFRTGSGIEKSAWNRFEENPEDRRAFGEIRFPSAPEKTPAHGAKKPGAL